MLQNKGVILYMYYTHSKLRLPIFDDNMLSVDKLAKF